MNWSESATLGGRFVAPRARPGMTSKMASRKHESTKTRKKKTGSQNEKEWVTEFASFFLLFRAFVLSCFRDTIRGRAARRQIGGCRPRSGRAVRASRWLDRRRRRLFCRPLVKENSLVVFDTWVGKIRDGRRTDATIVNNSVGVQ